MLDLLLTIAHHFLVFALVAILTAEMILVRRVAKPADIVFLARIDAAYGAVAGLIIIAGFSRVFWGAKGPDFFIHNPVFWAKIGTFVIVGLLSVPPTLRILGWRRSLRDNPDFRPEPGEAKRIARLMHWEAVLIPFILVFAAAMVRGYGL